MCGWIGLDLRNVYRSDKIATVILCWSHALCDGVAGAWITLKWRENYVKYSLKYLVSDSNENLKDFSCSKRDKHTKCLQIVSQQFLPRCKQANTTDLISLQRQTTKKEERKNCWTNFFYLLYLVPINGNWCRLYSHLVGGTVSYSLSTYPFVMDTLVFCVL